jgi:ABC-type transporter Mla subunit MlaD
MELEEFETQTRDAIEQTLNQLHTATLLVAQLETQISETGRAVQALSQMVETFVSEQKRSLGEAASDQ